MDAKNIMQLNIKVSQSNFEDLKLVLSKLNIPIVALQDCKLGEEQSSMRRYDALLKGNCLQERLPFSFISKRVVHTKLRINAHLHCVAAQKPQ